MFSEHIGFRVREHASEFLHVRRGEAGHAVYGPYDPVRPGVFSADFELALARNGMSPVDDGPWATIDVTAVDGTVTLAERKLGSADLRAERRTFTLTFTLREFRALEYRVYATGSAELLVAQPRLVRLGDVTEPAPPADPNVFTPDPIEQQAQARAVLRLLRPQAVLGFNKIRLGNAGDGGYVCVDDFGPLDSALSFGINDDVSWDLDAADRGLVIHQFDHTVDDPAPDDHRMVFNRKMIAPHASETSASLADLIKKHDRRAARPNLMLKTDIEGGEWPMLASTSSAELARLAQIVGEFHYFQGLAELEYRRSIYAGLSKLHQHFAVVHVHANIVGGISNIGNVIFPNVLEVTFVNRALYNIGETDELFPGALDLSCDPNQPDLFLGSFRF